MTRERRPTEDSFNRLLTWLDADREQAALKYEDIRHSLIRIYMWNGCHEAEDLADEAINRVTERAAQVAPGYVGDPKNYFYAVANRLLKEWRRQPQTSELSAQVEPAAAHTPAEEIEELERLYECTDRCLAQLCEADRELILQYYEKDKQAKIDARKQIADDRRIGLNALRVKVYRIRAALHKCIEHCLEEEAAVK
jgi:RNA polymerase sigma factor (sigma-70 family)